MCLVTQSCPTLCYALDYSPPGSSVHGILQTRILGWVAIPFSRESSQPRDWNSLLPCRQILFHFGNQGSPFATKLRKWFFLDEESNGWNRKVERNLQKFRKLVVKLKNREKYPTVKNVEGWVVNWKRKHLQNIVHICIMRYKKKSYNFAFRIFELNNEMYPS